MFNLKINIMKTKCFLIVCVFMCATWTYSTAQDKANKAVQGWSTSTYWSPVFCDGEFVEVLSGGEIRVHFVKHYKDGLFINRIDQIKGTVTSEQTGEVFKIREVDKTYFTDSWNVTWHYNLKGDMGTHYIGTLTYNYWTGAITVGKTVCH